MWHLVHLIARPFEALLGLFCVLTAIVLYPDEEGTIQSKFEDFWIRVDDFKNLALSHHAAFMTLVAQLETRFLDRAFGNRLFSAQALRFSFCCSLASYSLVLIVASFRLPNDMNESMLYWGLLIGSLVIGIASILMQKNKVVFRIVIFATLILMAYWHVSYSSMHFWGAVINSALLIPVLSGGFVFDVAFIALTRLLLQWAGQSSSTLKVVTSVALSIFLSAILVGPFFVHISDDPRWDWVNLFPVFAMTNILDVVLALLFVLLTLLLLVHRALWPLLTRTLFRMADIGTKGRRAILTTVGLALIAAGVTGKVPELLQKLIEKLGG